MASEDMSLVSFVESLQREYAGVCKVLSNVGDIAYLVTFRFSDGVSMKLQLSSAYPAEMPTVIGADRSVAEVRSLWESVNFKLDQFQSILTSVFGDRLIKQNEQENVSTSNRNRRSPNRAVNKSKETIAAESDMGEKKARMKTVEEVVQRVIWDPVVDRRQVFVGYEDRFLGVLEKHFDDFGFELDITDSDERVPLHRVVYFRYGARLIWDKRSRLDHVFGSTCEPGQTRITLADVIKQLTDAADVEHQDDYGSASAHVDRNVIASRDYE